MSTGTDPARGALHGLRVVDASTLFAGPMAAMHLGDMGADVVKVEHPTRPDPSRGHGVAKDGVNLWWKTLGRNKRTVTINLNSDGGREAFLRLASTADVVIENFRPGGLDAKGLGYATLSARNPRLIYLSLKGYLPGPYENRTALDEVVQMQSGLAYMTGPPGRPLRAGALVNDMMGGMFGAIAVLAALRQRDATGRGQHLQSGLFENAAFLVSTAMLQQAMTGQDPTPMPAGRRAWGVYDVFDTKDGQQIFIGVVTDRQWEIFLRELNEPVLDNPDYATNTERAKRRDTLIPLVQSLLIKHDIATLETMCERAGLPFSRIARPWDLFEDPHLNASGGLLPITLPDGRPGTVPALPIRFGEQRLGVRLDLPKTGEHDAEILGPLRGTRDAAE